MPQPKKISCDVFEISMPKRFTFDDSVKFNQVLVKLEDNECSSVIIDLSKTEFMDSAGLGMLLLARDEAGKHSKTIVIKSPQTYVRKLFTISRFNELFEIKD